MIKYVHSDPLVYFLCLYIILIDLKILRELSNSIAAIGKNRNIEKEMNPDIFENNTRKS